MTRDIGDRLSRIEAALEGISLHLGVRPRPGEIVSPEALEDSQKALEEYQAKWIEAREAEIAAVEAERAKHGRPLEGVDDEDVARAQVEWMLS